ncbi:MAG: hypothetical protein ACLR5S_04255 [Ruminococcus sp.]
MKNNKGVNLRNVADFAAGKGAAENKPWNNENFRKETPVGTAAFSQGSERAFAGTV